MYRSQHLAERQLLRLNAISKCWNIELEGGMATGIHAAVGEYQRKGGAELDAEDSKELLWDELKAQLTLSWSVDHDSDRYEAYQQTHPTIEYSDEMAFLRAERGLSKTLEMRIDTPGTEEFDKVLDAWSKVDPGDIMKYGIDYGIRRTLALVLPLATAQLELTTGDRTVEELLAAYPAVQDDDEESRPRRFG